MLGIRQSGLFLKARPNSSLTLTNTSRLPVSSPSFSGSKFLIGLPKCPRCKSGSMHRSTEYTTQKRRTFNISTAAPFSSSPVRLSQEPRLLSFPHPPLLHLRNPRKSIYLAGHMRSRYLHLRPKGHHPYKPSHLRTIIQLLGD